MNKIALQVAIVVCGVAAFSLLVSIGYFTQIGMSQQFAPDTKGGNSPSRTNRPANNAGEVEDRGVQREPIPADESVWEDYPVEGLKNSARLKDRPGNFEVIRLVGEFLEGMYRVEPQAPHIGFPVQIEGTVVETASQWEEETKKSEKEKRESGRKSKNKLRSYNVVIQKITLQDFAPGDDGITNPAEVGMDLRRVDRFVEVRKRHRERCVLVLLRVAYESLQSDKVEGPDSDSDLVLCWVKKEDGWKLVWYDQS